MPRELRDREGRAGPFEDTLADFEIKSHAHRMHRPHWHILAALIPTLLGVASCTDSSPAPGVEAAAPAAQAEEPAPEPRDLSGIVSPGELARMDGPRGVVTRTAAAFEGHTLVMPLNSTQVHLMDLDGELVHSWETGLAPGSWSYLMDDGSLLHGGRQDRDPRFKGGGIGGVVTRFAPDGGVVWRLDFADQFKCQHHDLEPLPNGNILFISWERKSAEEAIALGRDPAGVGQAGLWPDAIYEVRPTLPTGGEIVWSWHVWDHLVQDRDPEKPNYGDLAERAGRIDVNACYEAVDEQSEAERLAAVQLQQQMAAIGYAGGDEDEEEDADHAPQGPPPSDWDKSGDWLHTNAVDYHPELDLIVMSSPELGEVYVIDHSTTTEEAAGSTGGRWGRGGDLLWRWGNPRRHGAEGDQQLFYQHDPTWIGGADDLRLLVFNNGGRRPDGNYSAVLELRLPFDAERGFVREGAAAWGPAQPHWSYLDREGFFSAFISGARRLPNGNTIVCSGVGGRIFEVTPAGEVVWDFFSELGGDVEPPEHAGNAPPYALYRADRYAPDHPGVLALH